ncbi:MAG: dihydroneopterin aldolase [Firmicutes bacterium]|nr:dihydroneopterin aldolase [Bacillota bacterium]
MAALIQILDITCYGFHGVLPEEQRLGQEFRISLELNINTAAPEKDLLSETVDYRSAVEIVRRTMEGPPRRLLETLAEGIAADLLALPGIESATIRICKPHPPIPEVKGGVVIEINRQRSPSHPPA